MAALAALIPSVLGGAATGLSAITSTLGLVGTGISVLGTLQAGREQEASYKYQQKVAAQNEDEARASSQRTAEAQRRQGRLMESRQRAVIAGSGGSTAEDSVLDLMGDTASEADLAARTELYKGEQQARGYADAGKVAGVNAKNSMTSAYIGAAGNLFSGVSSMYSRFGQQQKAVAPASAVALPYG